MPGFFSKEIKDLFSVDLYRSCAAEFIGTLLLTFMALGTGLTSPGDPVAASIEAGFYIGCAIRMLSTVSGGHVNPAVSVGFLVLGQITVIRFIFYSIIQTLGSVAGAALLKAVVPANQTSNDLGIIFPAPGVNDAQAIVCEMIITFFMLFGTFAMLDPKRIDVNGFAPFQIGLIVVINIFATFNISGGCMNPARTLGPSIVAGIYDKSWIYWVGDMTGAVLGALLYDKIFSTTACKRWIKADFRRCNAGDEETFDDKLATYKKTGPDENNHEMF
ncbi:Probable aquaporin TIP4-3,Aquaporin TIP2-1 [Mytilus coruscus]|uniref:Probable aquaporin TIP4-3,Aquaporin TIP2-1 n=1 Tax=Mytilus coruscus TaxID=42192 RepID=A0A6J8CUP2_MYTCO|nr:Probable aquaporin TIP4-3,Aquaporin TIP2-1 [Mytilus coruscus]